MMVPFAVAFHPSSRPISPPPMPLTLAGSIRDRKTPSSSTILFMGGKGGNKKKKKKPGKSSSTAKGFASAIAAEAPIDRFPYAGSVRPGKQSPQRVVASSDVSLPDYALDGRPKKGSNMPLLPWVIEVKKPEEIEKMRASGKLAREILDLAGRAARPGVTTDELLYDRANGSHPGPAGRLEQQFQELRQLPKAKQKTVSDMLEGMLVAERRA